MAIAHQNQKRNLRLGLSIILACHTALPFAPAAFSQAMGVSDVGSGKQLFAGRCAMCHTIGGGNKVGPDLAGVKNQPLALLRSNIERMQSNSGTLSQADIDALLSYLSPKTNSLRRVKTPAARSGNALPGTMPVAPARRQSPVAQSGGGLPQPESWGASLYAGQSRFINGGMPCAACHGLNGGGSAPPLAEIAHEKRGAGLYRFLLAPENRAMRQAYAGHPITQQEAQALSSYLETVGGSWEREDESEHRGRDHRFRREYEDDD